MRTERARVGSVVLAAAVLASPAAAVLAAGSEDPASLGKRCEAGEPTACLQLARLHESGSGVAKDVVRAVALYQRACAGGNASACAALGTLLRTGNGVPKDPARAASLYQRACDGGTASACSDLGVMYQSG